jgi:hypothetical protein
MLLLALQARSGNPPDVWIQLLRHLLQDAACRQALLARSSAAAAAPAELMLAQLAATIAEELAAVMHAQQPTAPEDGLPNARHELFEYMIGTLYA